MVEVGCGCLLFWCFGPHTHTHTLRSVVVVSLDCVHDHITSNNNITPRRRRRCRRRVQYDTRRRTCAAFREIFGARASARCVATTDNEHIVNRQQHQHLPPRIVVNATLLSIIIIMTGGRAYSAHVPRNAANEQLLLNKRESSNHPRRVCASASSQGRAQRRRGLPRRQGGVLLSTCPFSYALASHRSGSPAQRYAIVLNAQASGERRECG